MTRKPWVNIGDCVIILLALMLTLYSAYAIYAKPQNNTVVMIRGEESEWVFPLNSDETVEVHGPLGITLIRIHGLEAWVESSPCKNQICVAAGQIHGYRTWIACLPNNVFLLIEGNTIEGNITEGNNESGITPDSISW